MQASRDHSVSRGGLTFRDSLERRACGYGRTTLAFYTSVLPSLPRGPFLAVYFSGIVGASLLFDAIGLLLAVAEHAAIALWNGFRKGSILPKTEQSAISGQQSARNQEPLAKTRVAVDRCLRNLL